MDNFRKPRSTYVPSLLGAQRVLARRREVARRRVREVRYALHDNAKAQGRLKLSRQRNWPQHESAALVRILMDRTGSVPAQERNGIITELLARARDLAEGWVFRGKTGVERDRLVDLAIGFVTLALADLGSKEAVRLSKRFEFTLRCVLLDATRKGDNRTRLAPMSSFDDVSVQTAIEAGEARRAIAADDARREAEAMERELDDAEEAMRQLRARDVDAHDMLVLHANDVPYKEIGRKFRLPPSRVIVVVAEAKAFVRSVIQRRRDERGEGESYGRVG